ncbi:PREDICTED: uncharacterized protein LOC105972486 [Erythranthe guttata]|uniref:uncharacterized protein LOC105972486 n=1 Tax=Erythranthe guttata TaxID=4155 RepID=UPI00064DCD74|nr:PREDICTED: uncharacterized protein LOC105972486 [Erythranthe guttata]|eukprot:XP_012852902.1 PREDICTED: uncharacterized protein LOC105972486 [Erythranthe guttata]
MHVVLGCRSILQLWLGSPFYLKLNGEFPSFWTWLQFLKMSLSNDNFLLAVVVCWKLWDLRNNIIHGESGFRVDELVPWFKSYLVMFNEARSPTLPLKERSNPIAWQPPPHGVVKVNYDVAIPPGSNFYLTAMVARNSLGQTIWWSVERIPGIIRPVEGEAHAALKAILKAFCRGWPAVIMEGDCLNIIGALQDEDHSLTSYGAFIEEIKIIAKTFNSCSFSFVKRHCNQLAHFLARDSNLACLEGSSVPPNLAGYA